MTVPVNAANDVGTYREALRIQPFRRLAAAWTFSNFADSALFMTAAIWVKTLSGSDALAGLVFGVLGLPALLAPLIGHMVDRYSRRTIMVVNNLVSAAVVALLFLVNSVDQLWVIFVVIFLYGTTSYVIVAAQGGLVKDMIPDRLLAPANGLLSTIDQSLRLIAPLLGAGIFAAWGMQPVIALTIAAYIVGSLLIWTMNVSESEHVPVPGESFVTSSMAGFVFLWRNRVLRACVLTLVVAVAATGVVNVAIFATIEQGLGQVPGFLALILSIQGAGSVLGGIASASVIRKIGLTRTLVLGVALLVCGLLGLASGSLIVVIGCVIIGGFGVPLAVISYMTIRQRETPPRLQGRTGAATNLLINVPQFGASLLAAALIGFVDYRVLVLTCAFVSLTGVVPVLLYNIRQRRAGKGPV